MANRPTIMGTRHVIAAGHYLAAHAGFAILEAGGNAVDAGVAAGIAMGVLQTDKVNFGGVAPLIVYLAKEKEIHCIDGLGVWPQAITPDFFQKLRRVDVVISPVLSGEARRAQIFRGGRTPDGTNDRPPAVFNQSAMRREDQISQFPG